MNTLYIHLFNFLFQCVLRVLFFRVLRPQRPVPVWRQVVAVLSLGIMLPLFISVNYLPAYNLMDTVYRFFYRAGVYAIYLKLSKDCPVKVAVYVALLFTSIYTASQAVLQVPAFLMSPQSLGRICCVTSCISRLFTAVTSYCRRSGFCVLPAVDGFCSRR